MTQALCGLCGRPLGLVRVEGHHLVPKTFKGKEIVKMHKMCHQKVHSTFSERELENHYHTFERLLEHEEIQKFVKWIAKRPPEYYDKNDDTAARKNKRK
jgi:5-methylcytosine-specific restriction endonuclease McrA